MESSDMPIVQMLQDADEAAAKLDHQEFAH